MSDIQIREVATSQWGRCIEISNSLVELLVTVDVGPRVISYKTLQGSNVFCEKEWGSVQVGEDQWHIRGTSLVGESGSISSNL